jgi:hypothetical protein
VAESALVDFTVVPGEFALGVVELAELKAALVDAVRGFDDGFIICYFEAVLEIAVVERACFGPLVEGAELPLAVDVAICEVAFVGLVGGCPFEGAVAFLAAFDEVALVGALVVEGLFAAAVRFVVDPLTSVGSASLFIRFLAAVRENTIAIERIILELSSIGGSIGEHHHPVLALRHPTVKIPLKVDAGARHQHSLPVLLPRPPLPNVVTPGQTQQLHAGQRFSLLLAGFCIGKKLLMGCLCSSSMALRA